MAGNPMARYGTKPTKPKKTKPPGNAYGGMSSVPKPEKPRPDRARRGTDMRTGQPASRSAKPVPTGAQQDPKKPRVSKIPDWYLTNNKTGKTSGKTPGWARPGHGATGSGAFTHGRRRTTSAAGRSTGGGGGGSSSGGGGGSSSRGGRSSGSSGSRTTPAAPAAPAAPATAAPPADDAFLNSIFDPARRELDRQRQYMDTMRQQTQAGWDAYAKWAEDKRRETAGLLTTNQQEQQAAYDAARQKSDQQIAQYVDMARGGPGAAPQGADMAQATGAGLVADQAASASAMGMTNADYMKSQAAAQQKWLADQQGVNNAMAARGMQDMNFAWSRSADSLARKRADVESQFGQAKLDKFYKDRQYDLDKQAAEFLNQFRKDQLKSAETIANTQAQATVTKAAIDAKAKSEIARIRAQEAAGKLSNARAKNMITAAKNRSDQRNKSRTRWDKAYTDAKGTYADFSGKDTATQGELMRQAGANFFALGVPESQAKKYMMTLFGGRFQSFPDAIREFHNIYTGR